MYVNLPQESGWTALCIARHHGCQTLVSLLLARDDSIDSDTRDGSCLSTLFLWQLLAIVRSLLSTDPNAVDDNGTYSISIFVGFRTRQS